MFYDGKLKNTYRPFRLILLMPISISLFQENGFFIGSQVKTFTTRYCGREEVAITCLSTSTVLVEAAVTDNGNTKIKYALCSSYSSKK